MRGPSVIAEHGQAPRWRDRPVTKLNVHVRHWFADKDMTFDGSPDMFTSVIWYRRLLD